MRKRSFLFIGVLNMISKYWVDDIAAVRNMTTIAVICLAAYAILDAIDKK